MPIRFRRIAPGGVVMWLAGYRDGVILWSANERHACAIDVTPEQMAVLQGLLLQSIENGTTIEAVAGAPSGALH